MLLRNGYNILAMSLFCKNTDTSNFGDGHINTKNPSGDVVAVSESAGAFYPLTVGGVSKLSLYRAVSDYNQSYALVLGDGNTPVDFEDYGLSGNVISTITGGNFSAIVPTFDASSRKFTGGFNCVLSNTSGSSVTIREVGIVMKTHTYQSSTNCCYVYREVLATPITIAAGENVTYQQRVEFTFPEIS